MNKIPKCSAVNLLYWGCHEPFKQKTLILMVVFGDKRKYMIYEFMSVLRSVCLIYCYLSLKNTDGCPPPIYYNFPDITNNVVSYIASGLDPYTHYMVKVVAINGKGEGHPVNTTITTDEEGTIYQTLL